MIINAAIMPTMSHTLSGVDAAGGIGVGTGGVGVSSDVRATARIGGGVGVGASVGEDVGDVVGSGSGAEAMKFVKWLMLAETE
jgi:hypothetical protein